jgi:hypothetical protein
MIDILPLFGPLPDSATSNSSLCARMTFTGALSPVARTETGHWALAARELKVKIAIAMTLANLEHLQFMILSFVSAVFFPSTNNAGLSAQILHGRSNFLVELAADGLDSYNGPSVRTSLEF